MKLGKTRWLLVGVLCLAFWLAGCSNEEKRWEGLIAAGETAYQAGRYAEAEKLFLAALKEAEEFGGQAPRLAVSLYNLAVVYRDLGSYAEAEPLFQRALLNFEKALGPEHPDLATTLESYASLLRRMHRDAEAERLRARAKAISQVEARNPPK